MIATLYFLGTVLLAASIWLNEESLSKFVSKAEIIVYLIGLPVFFLAGIAVILGMWTVFAVFLSFFIAVFDSFATADYFFRNYGAMSIAVILLIPALAYTPFLLLFLMIQESLSKRRSHHLFMCCGLFVVFIGYLLDISL